MNTHDPHRSQHRGQCRGSGAERRAGAAQSAAAEGSDGSDGPPDLAAEDDTDGPSVHDGRTVSEVAGGFTTAEPAGGEILEAETSWSSGSLLAGRYRIVRFIGQGGMGKVYLAHDEMLNRPIALKRIPQEILFDADACDDLRQEANRLLDLAHENIVRIHTYYDGPTWPFIAMEFLEGPTLKQLLRCRKQAGRTFRPEEVVNIARQVACGLSYAHQKGIVHRDLKPGNLMLAAAPNGANDDVAGDEAVIKITDFGISRVIADGTLRQTGRRTGTLPYMSPEQYRGEVSTAQSDIYSLACTIYELVNGRLPFYTGDIGYQILHVGPRRPENVPERLGAAVLRGLAKEPQDRYESVDHMMDALEGRIQVRAPRLQGTSPGSLVKAALGAALGTLIVLAAFFGVRQAWKHLPGGLALPASSPFALDAGAGGGGAASERHQAELVAFRERVRKEITKDVPPVVGRNRVANPLGATDLVSLRFDIPSPTGSGHESALFDGLFFRCYRVDQNEHKQVRDVHGEARNGGRVFVLNDLEHGTYRLQGHVGRPRKHPPNARGGQLIELFGEPIKFRVDLKAPSIEVEPLKPRTLVGTREPLTPASGTTAAAGRDAEVELTTFQDSVEVQLTSSEEIAEAYYQKVTRDRHLNPIQPIKDPKRWLFPLAEGSNRFRVYAVDHAGNPSREVDVLFRRLRLEMASFEVVRLVGSRAAVRGVLRVEGDRIPGIKLLVNGFPAEPEGGIRGDPMPERSREAPPLPSASFSTSSSSFSASPEPAPSGPAVYSWGFTATVTLPEPQNNTIEVRYTWPAAGGTTQPFAHAASATLRGLDVAAPRVVLHSVPEGAVASTTVRVEGRVTPYFEGLEMTLENTGQGTFLLDLSPVSTPGGDPAAGVLAEGAAVFSHEVRLQPNTENTLQIHCSFNGQELLPAPPLVRIESDQIMPRLAGMSFEPVGEDHFYVVIRASEPLRQLRLQQIAGGEAGEWVDLEPEPLTSSYRRLVAASAARMHFRVEMIDAAGNVGFGERPCPYSLEELARLAPASGPDVEHGREPKSSEVEEP